MNLGNFVGIVREHGSIFQVEPPGRGRELGRRVDRGLWKPPLPGSEEAKRIHARHSKPLIALLKPRRTAADFATNRLWHWLNQHQGTTGCTNPEMTEATGFKRNKVSRIMAELKALKRVKAEGRKRSRVYFAIGDPPPKKET